MTTKQQLAAIAVRLRQPKIALLLVAILGALPAIAILAEAYIPAVQARLLTADEAQRLREQRMQLTATPIPEPFRPEAMVPWLAKVPVEENHAELLRFMLDIEAASGARIDSFSIGEEEAVTSNLLDALEAEKAAAEPTTVQQTPAEGGETASQPGTASSADAGDGRKLASESAAVAVSGTYAQVMDFWERLSRAGRLVVIQEWELAAAAENAEGANANEPRAVRLELRFNTFTAPAFADLVPAHDGSPARTDQAARRDDPTMSDERFFEQFTESQEGE